MTERLAFLIVIKDFKTRNHKPLDFSSQTNQSAMGIDEFVRERTRNEDVEREIFSKDMKREEEREMVRRR